MLSLPLPNCLADPQELRLPPEKVSITIPFVFVEIANLLHVRAAERSALCFSVLHYCLPKF